MVDSTSWPEPSGSRPDDAPPPPPPPAHPGTGPGAAPPSWPDDQGDIWRQPTTGSNRPAWLVLSLVAAVLVGLTTAGVAGVLVARSSSSGADVAVAATEQAEVPFDEPTFEPDVVASPEDAVTAELLEAIDLSEQTMIEFQVTASDGIGVEGGLAPGGDELVREAASTGASRLEGLRSRLGELEQVEGGAATDGHLAIRDSYVEHLDAWRRWMQAVADDPALLEPGAADRGPFSLDIETTAEDFVVQMRAGLPSDTPAELEAYADFILQRGFSSSGGDGGELV